MKFKDIVLNVRKGNREADSIGLDRIENWTPLYIYLHVTRILIGFVLGLLFGLAISL